MLLRVSRFSPLINILLALISSTLRGEETDRQGLHWNLAHTLGARESTRAREDERTRGREDGSEQIHFAVGMFTSPGFIKIPPSTPFIGPVFTTQLPRTPRLLPGKFFFISLCIFSPLTLPSPSPHPHHL